MFFKKSSVPTKPLSNDPTLALKYENVSYTYNKKSLFATTAITDITYNFLKNKITAIIGNTGSGKSTIIMHANGLLIPDTGRLQIFNEFLIQAHQRKIKNYKKIRQKVGIVFQFPETQLFEETVVKDAMFGPKNIGFKEPEALKLATKALKTVRISERLFENSPFELSGGQKRRVAIAGILAMNPELLIFDEPTAGLDPAGEQEVCELFLKLKNEQKKSIIFVSHDMQLVLSVADVVIVVDEGKIIASQSPFKMFYDKDVLAKFHMINPYVVEIIKAFATIDKEIYDHLIKQKIRTVSELAQEIAKFNK